MLLAGKSIVVTDVVVFLASDKARYLNATTATVDGGLSQSSVGL
jgi:NAD(P)-dependent dehydrogenase (short-subunit alcohol dehydrogenase family)